MRLCEGKPHCFGAAAAAGLQPNSRSPDFGPLLLPLLLFDTPAPTSRLTCSPALMSAAVMSPPLLPLLPLTQTHT